MLADAIPMAKLEKIMTRKPTWFRGCWRLPLDDWLSSIYTERITRLAMVRQSATLFMSLILHTPTFALPIIFSLAGLAGY